MQVQGQEGRSSQPFDNVKDNEAKNNFRPTLHEAIMENKNMNEKDMAEQGTYASVKRARVLSQKKGKKGSQRFPSTHPRVRHPPLNTYSGMFREHPHHIATNK